MYFWKVLVLKKKHKQKQTARNAQSSLTAVTYIYLHVTFTVLYR